MDQYAAKHDLHWLENGSADHFGPQGKRDSFQN